MNASSGLSRIALGLTITLALIAVSALAAQTEPVAVAAQWEHLALTQDSAQVGSDRDIARQIVKLGEQGWELVTVSPILDAGTTVKTVYYFKRPK